MTDSSHAAPTDPESERAVAPQDMQQQGLGPKVFDFLRGTPWLGRPLHPALSYLPIGAWLTAAGLDVLGSNRGADRAIALGSVGAVPTMLTGCIDWYETSGRERQVGFVHMCINCTGMMFYMQSAMARSRGQRRWGVALSSAGLATILVGSWIGTDLVVKYGMGISPSAWAWLRRRRAGQRRRRPRVPDRQQARPQAMANAEEIRGQIQTLQRRLEEIERAQRLQRQVQQLEERVRALEAQEQQPTE